MKQGLRSFLGCSLIAAAIAVQIIALFVLRSIYMSISLDAQCDFVRVAAAVGLLATGSIFISFVISITYRFFIAFAQLDSDDKAKTKKG